jgi:hypothetical protein
VFHWATVHVMFDINLVFDQFGTTAKWKRNHNLMAFFGSRLFPTPRIELK